MLTVARTSQQGSRKPGAVRALFALFPALGLLLAGLFSHHDAYANPEGGLSLLAAMGTVGCLGYLVALVSRCHGRGLGTLATPGASSRAFLPTDGEKEGEGWPVLVALLFAPFFALLLSGLGGWVASR